MHFIALRIKQKGKEETLAFGMTLTTTFISLKLTILTIAEQVYPKWSLPTTSPISYLLANCFENTKLLSKSAPSVSSPSRITPKLGLPYDVDSTTNL